jgi:predicted ATPase
MFKLEFIKLKRHQQLQNIDIILTEKIESGKALYPYTSVIIGANGTGKSYILRTIAEVFRELNRLKKENKNDFRLPFDVHMRYYINEDSYEINISKMEGNNKKNYWFFKNKPDDNINVSNFVTEVLFKYKIAVHELILPQNLLVNSVIPTDRFVWQDSKPDDFYQYLGIRSTKTTASTKSSSRRTIKHLFGVSRENVDFKATLKQLLIFLEFEEDLKVDYSTKINKLFFSGNLNETDFRKYYEEWWDENFTYSKRKKENPLWSVPHYNNNFKDNPEAITSLVFFLNRISQEPGRLGHKSNSKAKILSINLFDQSLSNEEIEMVGHLENLDIINLIGIKVKKKTSNLSIEEISSGEYHLLISLIGIFSNISQNSLILIDEPEISLHPNWQMRYVSFLKNVFSNFSSCHFILTTHSHFLISDLEGDSSSVITLSRDSETNKLSADLLKGQDTFCWSPDDILYNVFNVISSRNKFVAEEIANILDKLSKGSKESINIIDQDIFNRLNLLEQTLKSNDPLKEVVKSILKKVNFK